MKRKKTNVILIAIVLSLTAVLTAQAKAATTFYEVWRNTEESLTTAQPIVQWNSNDSDGVIEIIDNNNVQPNQLYYYWVRSFKGENDAYCDHDYEHDTHSNAWIRMWYAIEADKNNVYLSGEKNWPFRVELDVQTFYDYNEGPQGYTVRIRSSVYEDNGPIGDVLLGEWIRDDDTDDLWYIKEFMEETKCVDLKDKAGDETVAEVYAKCRIDWPLWGNNIPMIFETSNVNVTFVDLENGPVVSAIGEPNGIRLRWNATRLQTTMFSQRVSVRLPKTIYVNHASTPADPNGNSWETAYVFLQDALQEARYNDIIYVAAPSFNNAYYPTQGNDRTATFNIPNGVKIYGGFPTNGSDPNQRDPDTYPTTLSGDIYIDDDLNDNSYHVVTISDCDANTVLDGFVIESGYSNDSIPNDRGAGIYITNSDVIIKNCVIAGNSGLTGSGIYCGQSNPAIMNCIFWDNFSEMWGGAGLYNEDSNTTVLNSKFILNKTGLGSDGGAIYNEASNISMTNCVLKCNTAKRNGGGIYNYDSMPKLTNCTFSGNIADVNGGGLFDGYNSSTEIKNSILWNNGDPEPLNEYSQFYTTATTPVIFNSCIQDSMPGDVTLAFGLTYGDNIDIDPLFVNDPNPGPDGLWNGIDDCVGNLKLQYGSPCIEAGNNSYLPTDSFDLDDDSNVSEPVSVDLADNLRLIDRDRDFIATVDMGAYERGVCPGNPDLDGSGLVNFADFTMLAAKWLDDDCDCHGSCCDGTDLNSDEKINVDDLAILAAHWLGGIESGLVAYYPFDGNNDDIAGGHGGGWNGGSFIADGVKGQAYQFSSEIYFTAGTIPEIDNVNQLTVAIWFKGRNTDWSGGETVVCKGHYTDAPAFQLWFSGNNNPQFFNIQINAVGAEYNSTEPYYVDGLSQWHHYTLVYDGNKAKAYVDGSVIDEINAGIGYINTTGHSLYVNRHTWWSSGSSSRLEGQVDEFRVYNRALSDLEIQQLYNLK